MSRQYLSVQFNLISQLNCVQFIGLLCLLISGDIDRSNLQKLKYELEGEF